MVKTKNAFTENDRLKTLVEEEPGLLGVLNRFGLSLGFGDATVKGACAADGVDCPTFLAVCNFMTDRGGRTDGASLQPLMAYLRRAHVYFLDFLLPAIRRKLIEAINCTDVNDIAFLMLKFFDDYTQEVRNHMEHENTDIFKYVTALQGGEATGKYRISEYSLSHESMADKLAELKDIFIYHYHVKDNEILTSALEDIIRCGEELTLHCDVENRLFIPAVEALERTVEPPAGTLVGTLFKASNPSNPPNPSNPNGATSEENPEDALTAREKEIVCCVARGMANKQIADRLCLSVHTVTTYRRNISAKLNIHSAAGLTIFAILHKLIRIEEIRV